MSDDSPIDADLPTESSGWPEIDFVAFDAAETILRQLPLRAPSAFLGERVRRSCRREVLRRRARTWVACAAVVVAGGAALSLQLWPSRQPSPLLPHTAIDFQRGDPMRPPPSAVSAVPAAANPALSSGLLRVRQTITRVSDDGVVTVPGNPPIQRVRRESFEQVYIIDPKTGQRLRVTVPVQETVTSSIRPF